MAYTPPLGNVAHIDLAFSGGGAYTPPAGNVAHIDFAPTDVLIGRAVTISQGSIVPTIPVALTGQLVTVSQGTITVGDQSTGLVGLAATIFSSSVGPDVRYAHPIIWTSGSYFGLTRNNNGPLDSTLYGTVIGPYLGYAAYDSSFLGWRKEGKWYVEFVDRYGGAGWYAGIGNTARNVTNGFHLGKTTAGGVDLYGWSAGLLSSSFTTAHNGTEVTQASRTFAAGDVIMCAVDFNAQKIWFGVNGTWVGGGNPLTGANPTYTGVTSSTGMTPMASLGTPGGATVQGVYIRAAPSAMTYVIPSGFRPWEDTDYAVSAALTTQLATISGGTVGAFHGVGVLTTQLATISGGILTPSIQVTGVLVGQSVTVKQMPFAGLTAGANLSVQLYSLAVTISGGSLTSAVTVGATGAAAIKPAAAKSNWPDSSGLPAIENDGWAMQNNFVSYDGVLLGAGDAGYKHSTGYWSDQRRFGYAINQTTRGKNWGNAPWTNGLWNTPGDPYEFDPFFSGGGDHYVSGEVYDFIGGYYAPGGQFSIDADGGMHFVHTRGYGLYAGRSNTTPDLVYYLQVTDQTSHVWRRNSFTVDGQHEMLMGVYGHTPTRTLVFYPTLSGSDWVPTFRVWDGIAHTFSSETQLTGFTGNGSCNAQHKRFCVTRSGYGDTIYVSYYSATGHIGLIVMDAVTLSVTSHVLTAAVSTGSLFAGLSIGGDILAPEPPTRSLAEVVRLSNGDSVTQFLLNDQFVRLKWTSGTATSPTQTLKTGPSSTGLVGGWESLEIKGDEVYHVVYERTIVSANYNSGTGKYDYIQDFRLYYNDATGTGASWTYTSSPVWSWTESATLNQISYMHAMRWSGYGGGYQSVVYSAPFAALGKPDATDEVNVAWVDLWAGQAPYLSATAFGRVGRVGITITTGVTVELAGLGVTPAVGTLTPKIAVTLAGIALTVSRGTLIAGELPPAGATLSTQFVTMYGGSLYPTVPLVGRSATVSGGVIAPEISVGLIGASVAAQHGALGVVVTVPLPGRAATISGGVFVPVVTVTLSGQSLATTSGVLSVGVSVFLNGLQTSVVRGLFSVSLAIPLTGLLSSVLNGLIAPATAVVLSGSVLVVSRGGFGVSLIRSLSGLQAVISGGFVGFFYDCNVFPLGVQAIGEVGQYPTRTNVPPIAEDLHLWAQRKVDELFVQTDEDEDFSVLQPFE